ncbi:MAG: DUF4153 domain-containing protein [Alphaproteobacteria bacterium]|nr:DUF4153 domain-containing protein [Alphaproteobacteria bacterium]
MLQGLALYGLYYAFENKAWPATAPQVFAPMALVALYVPLLVLQALGNLRLRTLLVWTAVAIAVAAGFAWYDIWHGWPDANAEPSGQVVVFTAVFLFVCHALISCIAHDRKLVPDYCTLFDVAWKQGVQLAIAGCFVGAFWIVLWLGVGLFELIKLHFFRDFINHAWFAIPVTAMAAAVSIHITDLRANLVRGVRTLALMLLSWLLPIIALIAFMFLIALVFTGLKPLWETRTATALLLVAAALLVILINAAYQDGDPERRPHHVLRVAGTLASIELAFVVAIAAYALGLRVDQYGWTVDRIDTAAVTLIAVCFAVGYFIAALLPSPWLKLIETWNFLTTILGLVVLFALFTPIADPLRISVNDQMARLEAGKVKPEKFDFWYLRWEGGRFGQSALHELSNSGDKNIASRALDTLNDRGLRGLYAGFLPKKHGAKDIGAAVTVHPLGRSLPATFVGQNWFTMTPFDIGILGECISAGSGDSCDAVLSDLNGDGSQEIILIYTRGKASWSATIYHWNGKDWQAAGRIDGNHCMKQRDLLLAGQFKAAPPQDPIADLQIGSDRVSPQPSFTSMDTCGGKDVEQAGP